jgi:hypothetical protein
MKIIPVPGGRHIKAWVGDKPLYGFEQGPNPPTPAADIDQTALEQLVRTCAKLPFIHPKGIAVMPDVHAGIGATVGSVIPTYKAIIPAAVGVDIGCGMNALRTSLKASDLPDSLAEIRHSASSGACPLGMNEHRKDRQARRQPARSCTLPVCCKARRVRTLWSSTIGARRPSKRHGRSSAAWAAATTSSSSAWTRTRTCG